MKKEKNTTLYSGSRKVATYVIVGIITFTMLFSVFAGLVSAIK